MMQDQEAQPVPYNPRKWEEKQTKSEVQELELGNSTKT